MDTSDILMDVFFHYDLGRGPLSTWASKNGVNMTEIMKELKMM